MFLSPRQFAAVAIAACVLLFCGGQGALASTSVSIAAQANVDGIGSAGSPVLKGGLDGAGDAYAAALLGTTATWNGVTFTLGQQNTADATSGSTVSLPAGKYTTLTLLAAGVNGNQPNQSFVVTYTDGTSSTFQQSVSDWYTPQNYAGESKALTEAYRLGPNGAVENGPFYVYGYSFAINSAKTVQSVVLPNNRFVIVLAVTLTAVTAPVVSSSLPAVSIPATPGSLAAISGNANASLTWSASTGATSYHVKRATTSGGPYTQVGAPTTASYTDSSLTNGTKYYYVVSALNSAGESANSAQVSALPAAPAPPVPIKAQSCNMQLANTPVIFCDTFSAPAAVAGTRTGDLDPDVWGVSRATGQVNFGGQLFNSWGDSPLIGCDGTSTVRAPRDVVICNGHIHEGTNDNPQNIFDEGVVLSLAMYPKQPFDFAGRTGTVGFDVSNDNHGNHSAWPEFWMSNLPVPDPFNHFGSWISLPEHGFGIRMASEAVAGQYGQCPNANNINSPRWTVDSAVIVRNYIMEDVDYQGVQFGTASNPPVTLNILDCVIAPADGSLVTNHVEIRINQAEIDIWASDAGVAPTPQNMRKIASVTNANLSFTRGLIWIEDVHYNADKGGLPSEKAHTFAWGNVSFDGPFTYRDFSYDAPDALTPCCSASNIVNLGQFALANAQATWNIANLPANPQASAVRVLFNFSNEYNPIPTVLNVTVNGHAHPTPWPYPDTLQNTWRTFAVTIPITDLVPGTNVVQLGSDQPMVSSNVDLVLVDVPGGVPVLPGSNNTYPAN